MSKNFYSLDIHSSWMTDSQIEYHTDKLHHKFYTDVNEFAVPQIIIAFKVKIQVNKLSSKKFY